MITSFQGQYRFLSNFWLVPIPMDGFIYPSVEHAYQAAKTLSPLERTPFQSRILKPGEAKRLGRSVKIRENWEDIKFQVMYDLLRAKFKTPELRERLLATGDQQLIEGNNWNDTFWGMCNGVGRNYLGKLLMKVRKEIQESVEEAQ